ncbi:MAG: extracellular solute-binding protein [Anaerolineae bacterium]|nr:extracellular solute-binding protein [Thermoflexales bacterium]MDW8408395.1 extracellular solute-binding protein [Anaerolineae bacterium]
MKPHIFVRCVRFPIGLVLVASLAGGCAVGPALNAATPTESSTQPGVEQRPTGELVVYTSRAEALFKPVVEAFNQEYPAVRVTLLTGSASELAARLLEERNTPRADVYISTDMLNMLSLAEQGMFEPNSSPAVAAVPLQYRAEDGSWVALTLRLRVIMYNTDLVKPDELPASVLDLTDDKWKGQVGSANSTNGSLMAHLVVLREKLGDAQTESFIKGLVANGTQFFGGHTDVRKAVGAGELKLGFVNHYYYHLSKAEGAPVGIVYPDQGDDQLGMAFNTTNAGIVAGAPHPDLARLFVDFMLSPRGQRIYAERNFEYPIVPGTPLAEGVPALNQFKLVQVSLKDIYSRLADTKALAQAAGLP